MRILLSAYACEPNQGTEKGFGWNWAINLARVGHEVWVLTRPEGRREIEELAAVSGTPYTLSILKRNGVWGIIAQILRQVKLDWQYLYLVWQLRALGTAQKLDREIDFDIVHHVSWGSIIAGSWLWLLDKPFVLGPVGGGQIAPVALKQYFGHRWRHEAIRSLCSSSLARFNLVARQSVSQADLVLATNRDTLDLAQELGAKRVKLYLDSGLPPEFFADQLPTKKPGEHLRLLWVGSSEIRKGLRLTLESIAAVDVAISWALTIVGVHAQDVVLRQLIAELNLGDKVNCLGRVSWERVKAEYASHDVFYFTSLRDSFGSQLLEAMAWGLPLITLDHHGARDFVPQDAGIKVPIADAAGTVAALARAIEYLYHNPRERQ
ncbi:MAG: glycosyltransferase family 4 protein [Cyanobacteria bacterium J06623_7]